MALLDDLFIMNRHLFILVCLGLSSAATTTRFDPFTFFALTGRLGNSDNIWQSLDTQTIDKLLSKTPLPSERDCNQLVNLYTSNYPNEVNSSDLHSLCKFATLCFESSDADDLLSSLRRSGSSPSADTVALQKCSLMLVAHDAQNCRVSQPEEVIKSSQKSSISVWLIGFLSVTVINLTSVIGIIVVPFLNKSSYLHALNLFEGLAVGSLTGSAIFHLIPAAFDLVTVDSKHGYLYKSLMIFGGIYLFYWSEKFMGIYSAIKSKSSQDIAYHATTSGNSHPDNQLEAIENGDKNSAGDFESRLRSASDSLARVHHGHSHEHNRLKGQIAPVAWMIVFGDGLHNFIDGLSIGAAFNDSILTGLSICVAVVCEEFPHELGDFAVLIASGMSVRQAVGYNFLSACTCYLGLIMGIWLGDLGPTYIFALAAGMFLYIALVDMMSELTSSVENSLKNSISETATILFLQNLGIIIGIVTLFLLARYQENIRF